MEKNVKGEEIIGRIIICLSKSRNEIIERVINI